MNRTTRLLDIFTLHCEGASELISREQDESLPLLERMALAGHLLACQSCRVISRQMRQITRAVRGADIDSAPVADDDALSPEAREKIASALSLASRPDSNDQAS